MKYLHMLMKYLYMLLLAFLLSAPDAAAQSRALAGKCAATDEQTLTLINDYQELRERRSRLAAGGFDEDLNAYDGKLHRVLVALGERFGRPSNTKQNIQACLGQPDAIRSEDRMSRFLGIYQNERRKAGKNPLAKRDREYFIYFWRGWHDFIFFISEDNRIIDSGWWFAYE
ncbi:MAG: hypothetical protein QOF02_2122 [Blastocatellia bacterium]|jgi:hypothetical protein|nr:hypothetical protein [Blastocatellia bacterium]